MDLLDLYETPVGMKCSGFNCAVIDVLDQQVGGNQKYEASISSYSRVFSPHP